MKNLNLTFVAIIFALFALTSCEKESMSEMTQNTTTEIKERNLPAAGINKVFEEVQTEATAASYKESANSRNRGHKEIGCGFDYDGCTINQGNSLDLRHYPRKIDELAAEYGVQFDGQDEYFVWEVEATPGMTMIYDLELTGLRVDLDLFVFALNSRNQLSAVKGMSINSGSKEEKLSLSGLAPGIYIVVVDAYRYDIAGHYNLTMECSAVGVPVTSPNMKNATRIKFGGGEMQKYSGTFGDGWTVDMDNQLRNYEEIAVSETELTIQNIEWDGDTKYTRTITFSSEDYSVSGGIISETPTSGLGSTWFSEIIEIN